MSDTKDEKDVSDTMEEKEVSDTMEEKDVSDTKEEKEVKQQPTTTETNAPESPVVPEAEPEQGIETAVADASLLRKLLRSKLVEHNIDIEVERANPDSPLYSVKKFEELKLKKDLLLGIYAMGFTKPSKIQEKALPALINDPPQNLIAQSQSGTGKTAAFTLTMLTRIDTNLKYPQALCLAPTMELAAQIAGVVAKMGQFMQDLSITLAVKGTMVTKNGELQNQIVIGTPGTVLDWCTIYRVIDLRKIRAFVLDEADVMMNQQGHGQFCIKIIKGLDKSKCQMMLFSATYNNTVMDFAIKVFDSPMILRLRRNEESLDYIKQFYVTCQSYDEKFSVVMDILSMITVGQAIVFCQTKVIANRLAAQLAKEGISIELLTGELLVEQRVSVIERFRDGKSKILITTNVTARGIDVDDVKLVVNFDLPVDHQNNPDFETYLHRIGRTGRFGKAGIAINLVESSNMPILSKIESHFAKEIRLLDASNPEDIENKLNNLSTS